MKKILSTVVAAAFVLGMAGSALAIHETKAKSDTPVVAKGSGKITMDGYLQFRGWTKKKTTNNDDTDNNYDTKVKLGVKAQMSDATTGYFQIETGDGSGDTYNWGQNDGSSLHAGGTKGAEGKNDLSVLQAWISYDPGVVGVKIGHMPLALGHKTFFDHTGSGDDAIVIFADPSKDTHIGLLTIKFTEGSGTDSDGGPFDGDDDIDGYVALINQQMGAAKLGAQYTYLRGGDSAFVPGISFSNLGLTADVKAGAINLKGAVDLQFGDLTNHIDQSAYAVRLEGSTSVGAVTIGAIFGYGSGDDGSDATENENFTNFLTDTVYDSTMVGYYNRTLGQATNNTGLANMMLVGVYVKGKVDKLGYKVALNWMKLNEEVSGQDELGVEIHGAATYKIDNGLTAFLNFGYLFAGDAWDASSASPDPDNAYWIRPGIKLSF